MTTGRTQLSLSGKAGTMTDGIVCRWITQPLFKEAGATPVGFTCAVQREHFSYANPPTYDCSAGSGNGCSAPRLGLNSQTR